MIRFFALAVVAILMATPAHSSAASTEETLSRGNPPTSINAAPHGQGAEPPSPTASRDQTPTYRDDWGKSDIASLATAIVALALGILNFVLRIPLHRRQTEIEKTLEGKLEHLKSRMQPRNAAISEVSKELTSFRISAERLIPLLVGSDSKNADSAREELRKRAESLLLVALSNQHILGEKVSGVFGPLVETGQRLAEAPDGGNPSEIFQKLNTEACRAAKWLEEVWRTDGAT